MARRAGLAADTSMSTAERALPRREWLPWARQAYDVGQRSLLGPIYGMYERHLVAQVRRRPSPRHVGIILDGNRRFGLRSGLSDPLQVYSRGAQKLDDVLGWCMELAIPAVTLWVCSTDNLDRPAAEVAGILGALETKLHALVNDPLIHRHRIRVQAIGSLDRLPAATLAAIRAAQDVTAGYDTMLLSIAVAYGGREEIASAVRDLLANKARDGASADELVRCVTPEAIGRHLYLADAPEPDLIIRTSGEVRLSGFLLWQSAYSEFYFTDVLWPSFRHIDFLRAVRSFQQRRRRFGR
jgi:short-chain Z-isoprenyl diphosphate synthase